ncbi:MAG TPA: hypothetical protein VGM20_05675 [Gemmatimonadales bacterium]|jgi:hypothetical protein
MRARFGQLTSVIFGILMIGALGGGLYLFVAGIIGRLSQVGSDVGKAIVGGTTAIIVAAATVVLGKAWEQRVKLQQDLRERKAPVYEKLITTLMRTMAASKYPHQKMSDREVQAAMQGFTEQTLMWGGNDVIRAWGIVRNHDWKASSSIDGMDKVEALLRAIRVELGNRAKLQRGDLIWLFINDYDAKSAEVASNQATSAE